MPPKERSFASKSTQQTIAIGHPTTDPAPLEIDGDFQIGRERGADTIHRHPAFGAGR